MANGRVIFLGTAAVAVPFLDRLQSRYPIGLVITGPDARGGRGAKWLQPPLKMFALERGLPVLQPENLRDPELADRIRREDPLVAVVVSYGKWIPATLHHLPLWHTVNVHFSLLPRYRGAAPVQRALQAGEAVTGITLFEITGRMDAGDIWAQQEVSIDPEENARDLLERLSRTGADFLLQTLETMASGQAQKRPQDHALATYAPAIKKEEGRVDWNLPARSIVNALRAFFPWPGLSFSSAGKPLKVIAARASRESSTEAPGTVLGIDRLGLHVACGQGSTIDIVEIQPAGKKAMTPHDYGLGNCLAPVLS